MYTTELYYSIKPFVPWSVRVAVRRWLAKRKLPGVRNVWPVLPGTERPPMGWAGWPEGRRFAFVLSHDVEGPVGLSRCRSLMDLERELGFRSSFNLVPEGSYRVPAELRAELCRDGFEVGVHDLHHDGKLYRNRHEFARMASRINSYLRDWSAVGFRSGFMRRNFEWLHDLEVAYDASSFDTDPFEPQPEPAGTIFPFWVSRPDGATEQGGSRRNGYVELPYTLPQDSTLFLILGEQTPDIWLRKLDWLAEHGGMALVNVHPDYTWFGGGRPDRRSYPVSHYRTLLETVNRRYRGDAWLALPREVAEWCRRGTSAVEAAHGLQPLLPR